MGVGFAIGWLRRFVLVGFCGSLAVGACRARAQQLPEAPAVGNPASMSGTRNFFGRWMDFYRKDWKGSTAPGPPAARRGLPSPLNSPPFPNADWSYGGSPTIREPDTASSPLITALTTARTRTQ